MANTKTFSLGFESGATVYFTVQRKADGYLLDDADGTFQAPPVTDFELATTPNSDQPSIYEAEEARVAWSDGTYLVCFYLQLGGSPAPTTDPLLASKDMAMVDDAEVASEGGVSIVINDSSSRTTSTTDEDLAALTKLVKAILHDNKMILDRIEKKGRPDAATYPSQKAPSYPRRGPG